MMDDSFIDANIDEAHRCWPISMADDTENWDIWYDFASSYMMGDLIGFEPWGH